MLSKRTLRWWSRGVLPFTVGLLWGGACGTGVFGVAAETGFFGGLHQRGTGEERPFAGKAPDQKGIPPVKPALPKGGSAAQWAKVAEAAVQIFENQHYSKAVLNRAFSAQAFERYLEALDPQRLVFLKADVEELRAHHAEGFIESLKSGSFRLIDSVEQRRGVRIREHAGWLAQLFAGNWDFSTPWTVEDSREHSEWPVDQETARRVWREQVGSEILSERLEGAPMAQAVERVRRRYEEFFGEPSRGIPEKMAAALMGFARAFDAHSDYLTQDEFEANEGELHLTRVGIGVTLDKDPSGLRVVGILPGGPAQRDGRLRVNDRIVAVAEEGKSFRELGDLPYEERVRLIRGKRGALIRIRVAARHAAEASSPLVIGLRREEMRSRDGEVYGKCVEIPDSAGGKTRVGWIVVPAFYGEEGDGKGVRSSSVARDVSALLKRLKAEQVGGVVLDLRGNAGGLLDEAVELGGIFCGRAPIAMVRAPQERVEVLVPEAVRKPQYEGPLAVLVDRESASASELLAAALQDHKRAVVVGGEKTFGKGTVQATFQLGEYLHSRFRAPVGGLLVTLGKFYRVSGESTQLRGVRPDVVLPSTLDGSERGEAALVNPLPHDAVAPVWGKYSGALTEAMIRELRLLSARRVENSVLFQQIGFERARLKKVSELNRVSLLESERREELERHERMHLRWQQELRATPEDRLFASVRMEDLKLKTLPRSAEDPFQTADPEWNAMEGETLNVMRDLIGLWKKGRSAP